jgi:hypothetical protein
MNNVRLVAAIILLLTMIVVSGILAGKKAEKESTTKDKVKVGFQTFGVDFGAMVGILVLLLLSIYLIQEMDLFSYIFLGGEAAIKLMFNMIEALLKVF